jgi:hypothetical protein
LVLGPAVIVTGSLVAADGPALTLHARAAAAGAPTGPMTIELFRWSTDSERAPLVAALSAPTPLPAAPATPAPGRGAGRAAGRGARGGRAAAAPPLSPAARLDAAIKAAPTCGYIWSDGVTGYSIKYAWRSPSANGGDRIVLVTARRLGVQSSLPPTAAVDSDFTIIEMQLDQKGIGEAKASHANVILDPATKTLALDSQASSPLLLKVTR